MRNIFIMVAIMLSTTACGELVLHELTKGKGGTTTESNNQVETKPMEDKEVTLPVKVFTTTTDVRVINVILTYVKTLVKDPSRSCTIRWASQDELKGTLSSNTNSHVTYIEDTSTIVINENVFRSFDSDYQAFLIVHGMGLCSFSLDLAEYSGDTLLSCDANVMSNLASCAFSAFNYRLSNDLEIYGVE